MERLRNRLALLLSRRKNRSRRIPVAEKFTHFRAIGAANDAFLHRLASLQERIDWSKHASGALSAATAEALSSQVGAMVNSLVAMTGGRYEDLRHRYEQIHRELGDRAADRSQDEDGPVIIWPEDPEALRSRLVGPKTARLAETAARTGLKVPPFFSVSTCGYRIFMRDSGIQAVVNELLLKTDLNDPQALKVFCESMAAAFLSAPIPRALENELLSACARLADVDPGLTGMAVRSSAVVEDAASSFAGQFESILNVRARDLPGAYKRVIESKYHLQALRYSLTCGFKDEDIAMPVLVMAMVRPSASGVAYSRSPANPDTAMITAVSGLAQAIVEGKVTPDTFMVPVDRPTRVQSSSLGKRAFSLLCADDGGLREQQEDLSAARAPALSDKAACAVARAAIALEQHFGAPQDVEWVLDADGSLLVVQTGPVYLSPAQTAPRDAPAQVEGYRILVRGATRASGGVAAGRVYQLPNPRALETVPEGVILCVPTTSPQLAGVMGTVRGIVAVAGSPTGHMATIAREFDVPCLVGAEKAPGALQNGMMVTLDADAGIVYEGEVRELLRDSAAGTRPPRRRREARESDSAIVQHVAPLTLTEPDAPGFCPENCRTLHDIARFVHQKSMAEMFANEDLSSLERRTARRLLWRVPMDVLLLDLGGGLAPEAERSVTVDQVQSAPLRALIEGMTDPRLRWAGPVGFDLKGFMSVVVRSAADDQRYGEPNYCLCAQDYVHFATRLAYHFATVDAICGPSVNENYARFLFFGGAAVTTRREWRAHFLATVLNCNGFGVKQVSDRVEAIQAKRSAEQIEESLVMLGRLMVASRHLDMVIESQAAAHALAQAFLSGDYGFENISKAGA